ncbi:beta-N-acetylhexosaminidase [Clostridium sartagoforme AAU1]|jgi:beta-N-acetylhexosaminidase|uniref:beta-N-acetylhexosaminidase n=1 Tax=Clostridium sartagoforme AAU1 TaxID=1202534 RepID=R9CD65_9CLOT|nr:glycoside hydrolase family 3 N-terminal domain-containing protein [Clostridium sartagoforme]EOR25166.1 beta-N-acetylhexosaminidase [Clostridium sartagoforme AAU1]
MNKKKISLLLAATMITTSLFTLPSNRTYAMDSKTQAKEIVSKMTLDEKIGQMIMPDFRQWKAQGESAVQDVTVMNSEIAEIVDKYDLGGVILFANNVKDTEQTVRLVNDYQQVAINDKDGNLPLLLTIDQEGGVVTRLGTGTNLPGNMAIGATRSEDDAYDSGYVIGRELKSLGINVDFAPTVDVNNNPNNPVIHLRSISSNPDLVGRLGSKIIEGIQGQGVSAAAKHFPGHGDTATDSHYGLPVVNKSIEELRNMELKPFKAAIDKGVDMIMTAHIQFPQVEKDTYVSKKDGQQIAFPATLSDDIVTGILRKELSYDGVVVTDALNMQAISDNFGESEAVKLTFKAGVDIALMPTILRSKADVVKLENIINEVKAAVGTGEIPLERIDQSAERVVKLKIDRGIMEVKNDTRTLEEKINNAKTVVGSKENRDIERRVAANAITVVKNENNILPLNPKEGDNILLLAPYDNELPGMKFGITRLISEGKINDVNYDLVSYNKKTILDDATKAKIDLADEIVILSEISSSAHLAATHWLTKYPTEVFEYAKIKGKSVILGSLGHPYDVTGRDGAAAKVIAYGYKGMDPTEADGGLSPIKAFGPNIPAIMDVIFGAHEATGILPVDVPNLAADGKYDLTSNKYNFGYGITNLTSLGTTSVEMPTSIKEGKDFIAKVKLNDVPEHLQSKTYSATINFNTNALEVLEVKSNSENVKILNNKIENGKLIIDVEALNDKVISNESFEIKFKAKTESISEVIKVENLSVKDNKDRIFIASLSEAAIQLIEDKAPSIIAEDKTLTVGDKFDPMKDVKASDEEDGDISSNIKVKENNVDTTKAGEYKVVYSVEDSNKNITEKIVKITVKAKSDNTDNNNGKGNNDNLPETGGASPVGTVILGSIMAIAGIALRKFKK